jgi:hypothetical protein
MEADMPNGIFPVPEFRPVPARTRLSLAVRIRTRWRRDRLDKELSHGADPATTDELRLRATQLRSPAVRAQLANALVERLGDARRNEPMTLTTRPQRAEVRNHADDLLALVERLRDDRPVNVRGAAMTARLANEGASPLYRHGGQDLQGAARAARRLLDTTGAGREDLATAA